MKLSILQSLAIVCFAVPADGADDATRVQPIQTQRVDVQVDGGRPLAGERSCFAVSPNGEISFTWTLAAGEFSCKPLGHISTEGRISYAAIDSETTWNVEGWGSFGLPFDLAYDRQGHLHVAARFHGQPYGVDYWHQADGQWRLETFGQNVTFGGNNVALAILPDGRPIVVCMTRDRSRLAVWERTSDGQWNVSRPDELQHVAAGHFDLVVSPDGNPQVLFCPRSGGPQCVTRTKTNTWNVITIAQAGVCRHLSATSDADGRHHISFAAGSTEDTIRNVIHAGLGDDGTWTANVVAQAEPNQHVNRTDIATASGRTAIVWERGQGAVAISKDYGSTVGSVEITLLEQMQPPTTKTLARSGGRPSLALTPDGQTAWVGVYTGNENGDDFFLLNCNLDGDKPSTVDESRDRGDSPGSLWIAWPDEGTGKPSPAAAGIEEQVSCRACRRCLRVTINRSCCRPETGGKTPERIRHPCAAKHGPSRSSRTATAASCHQYSGNRTGARRRERPGKSRRCTGPGRRSTIDFRTHSTEIGC